MKKDSHFSFKKNYLTILKKIILLNFIIFSWLISFNCSQKQNRKVIPAFYFWQTNFDLTKNETDYLNKLNVHKLYVKFFDVDWNALSKTPVPVGDLQIETNNVKGLEIVPTVFITNRTLENIKDPVVRELSFKIFNKITGKLAEFKDPVVKEVQLDCDWTAETKNKYFLIIEELEKLFKTKNISITATIRLHQVKYFKSTGVPPVKRGMLMFYNMSPVTDYRTKNSIFDAEAAKKYLTNFDIYPLPLDVALPAFSWGVLFSGDKIEALINDLTKKEIEKDSAFEKVDDTHFRSTKNQYFKGFYIKKFDMIRLETITPAITKSAAELISPKIKNDSLTVAIYHLNNGLIKNYEPQDIQSCYSVFR